MGHQNKCVLKYEGQWVCECEVYSVFVCVSQCVCVVCDV